MDSFYVDLSSSQPGTYHILNQSGPFMYSLTFEFYSILMNFFKFSLIFTCQKWFSHLAYLWTLHPDTPELGLLLETPPRFPYYIFNCLLPHLLAPSLQFLIFISSITSVSFLGFLSPFQSSELFIYCHRFGYIFFSFIIIILFLLLTLPSAGSSSFPIFLSLLPFNFHLYFNFFICISCTSH
jgi:hypothetical protein